MFLFLFCPEDKLIPVFVIGPNFCPNSLHVSWTTTAGVFISLFSQVESGLRTESLPQWEDERQPPGPCRGVVWEKEKQQPVSNNNQKAEHRSIEDKLKSLTNQSLYSK